MEQLLLTGYVNTAMKPFYLYPDDLQYLIENLTNLPVKIIYDDCISCSGPIGDLKPIVEILVSQRNLNELPEIIKFLDTYKINYRFVKRF
jgi:hypothetical protein